MSGRVRAVRGAIYLHLDALPFAMGHGGGRAQEKKGMVQKCKMGRRPLYIPTSPGNPSRHGNQGVDTQGSS